MKKRLRKFIEDWYFIFYILKSVKLFFTGITNSDDRLSDEEFIRKHYKKELGTDLNLNEPLTLNEKLQWLKLYAHTPLHTICADKIAVKEYVKSKIGEDVIISTIMITDNYKDINPQAIKAERFVVKPNHSSGNIMICKDRDAFNWGYCRIKAKFWLKEDYYRSGREPQYRDIRRQLIVEEFLENGDAWDYKLYVFQGRVEMIQIISDRFSACEYNFYDRNWNLLDLKLFEYEGIKTNVERPKSLDKMIAMAECLAGPFKMVRVDFYETEGKPFFGEMTFHPYAGFMRFTPPSTDEKLGKLITL